MKLQTKIFDPSFKGGIVAPLDVVLYYHFVKNINFKILEEQVSTSLITIIFRKNSYLVEIVNEKLRLLQSAGIVSYWTNKFYNPDFLTNREKNAGPRRMTLKILSGAFELIVFGWIISVLTFVTELAVVIFKHRKKTAKVFSKFSQKVKKTSLDEKSQNLSRSYISSEKNEKPRSDHD